MTETECHKVRIKMYEADQACWERLRELADENPKGLGPTRKADLPDEIQGQLERLGQLYHRLLFALLMANAPDEALDREQHDLRIRYGIHRRTVEEELRARFPLAPFDEIVAKSYRQLSRKEPKTGKHQLRIAAVCGRVGWEWLCGDHRSAAIIASLRRDLERKAFNEQGDSQ